MARRLTEKDKALHEGVWRKDAKGSHEIRGRRLGIVGYGNIGSQLSVVAEMLGMEVYFYDIQDRLALGNARRCSSLEELLDMRPRSLFLNLSRGFLVDYEALRDSLQSGHIAGASVDVFPVEPKKSGDPFSSPLQGMPNTVLTPHVGGSTEEAQEDIGRFVAGKLRDFVAYGTTTLSVNLPALTLQHVPGDHRLTHFHTNTPGVLAKVNQILASHGVNIGGQLLGTQGHVGYVVTDVDSPLNEGALAELHDLPETIRLRVVD